jgi:hypothetical protein
MAPALYYYPRGAASYATVTLPYVSRINPQDWRDVVDARAARTYRQDWGGGRDIEIRCVLSRGKAAHVPVLDGLESLISHLRAGGRCAFVLDADTAWAGWCGSSIAAGTTSCRVDSSTPAYPFLGGTLAEQTRLLLQDGAPERYEKHTVSSVSSTTVTFGEAQRASLYAPVLVREEHTYPVLYLPEEAAADGRLLEDSERAPGLVYTLSLPLRELPGELMATYTSAPQLATPTGPTTIGALTLESATSSPKTGAGRTPNGRRW